MNSHIQVKRSDIKLMLHCMLLNMLDSSNHTSSNSIIKIERLQDFPISLGTT